ncbi:hypothetical protein V2J09_006519 [Rumex salicifolius]
MVQLKEFRIVMPMSVEEYEVAQLYMVLKMQQQTATNTEGIEILQSRPFEDNVFGKGYYTSKLYRFQRFRLGLPVLHLQMLSSCKKKLGMHTRDAKQCPYFEKMLLTIETIHVADNGESENVHGLSKEQLEMREVEVIDIASAERDYWSYMVGCCDTDFSQFRSSRTGRGPLLKGWKDECRPVMTAYKLVTVDAPYWGFGRRIEQALISGERALFLETHRHSFSWIDDWYGMTTLQLRELEKQYNALSAEERQNYHLSKTAEALDRKCSLEREKTFKHDARLEPKERLLGCSNS